jgi:hypothetical protein
MALYCEHGRGSENGLEAGRPTFALEETQRPALPVALADGQNSNAKQSYQALDLARTVDRSRFVTVHCAPMNGQARDKCSSSALDIEGYSLEIGETFRCSVVFKPGNGPTRSGSEAC